MLVKSRALSSDLTCVIKADAGNLLGFQKTQIWNSLYLFTHWFTLQANDYDVNIELLLQFSVISDVIQEVERHHDLIKHML